jgi:uncharacterized protein YcbK (DUF882 family)
MKITKNFNLSEFQCKCGCEMPYNVEKNIIELADNLQILRDYLNKPINPTNGFRCITHNKNVGGVKNSQHILGKAADIKVKDTTPEEVANAIEHLMEIGEFKMGGVGRYNTFTHVDIRGSKARWNKTKK